MTPIESHWRELSNGILVDIGVQNLTPNHPCPLQNTGIAASDSFWPSPPRNSYCPQFGSACPITIPLIHSWYGPLVGIVSAPGGAGWWRCEFLRRTYQKLMLLAIAGSGGQNSWFGVKFQTQTSTKIPLESSDQGLSIGVKKWNGSNVK